MAEPIALVVGERGPETILPLPIVFCEHVRQGATPVGWAPIPGRSLCRAVCQDCLDQPTVLTTAR